ncbi:hypothetical protein Q5A_005840 [Serratia inhibens PRI-2C]|nr:hypothetical protein Q5A_005840 [Serratia inhibens PRI-2C]
MNSATSPRRDTKKSTNVYLTASLVEKARNAGHTSGASD